jgi:glutamate-1-semialdehyde 2,1-aminomutase
MFSIFFSEERITSYDAVARSDVARFNQFFHAMLDEGIYLAPSAFEAAFVSAAHDSDIVAQTIAAADRALAQLARS